MQSASKKTITAFASAFVALLAALNTPAWSSDKAYTVGNYPVEAVAANAVAAKEKALAEGQEAAFRSLLKRLVPVTAYPQLERFKDLRAAEIVDGVRVRSEQNSRTRYIASLDFTYRAEAVRDLLARQSIPFVEELAPEIVLVPIKKEAAPAAEGSLAQEFHAAQGTWNNAWHGLDLENTLTPARIAPLRERASESVIRKAMSEPVEAEAVLSATYSSENVVLAIAEIDKSTKRLNVTLAGRDAVGPIAWSRAYRIYDGDIAYAMEFASVVSLGVLEGRWKTLKSGGAFAMGGGEEIELLVQFSTREEWRDLRGRILELPGIADVRVNAVSEGTASMAVKYPGGGRPLSAALARQGVSLVQSSGVWLLRTGY